MRPPDLEIINSGEGMDGRMINSLMVYAYDTTLSAYNKGELLELMRNVNDKSTVRPDCS